MAVEVNNTATQANADKRTYSVQEIADILQISRSMAYVLCRKSLFKTVRVGKYVRISKPSFDAWLDRVRSSAVTGQRRMMGRFRFTIGRHRPFCIRVWEYPNKQFCV